MAATVQTARRESRRCSRSVARTAMFPGFGLKADARASALKVFEEWVVSFHGCPSNRLPSILDNKGLLKPGDVLLDGTKLPNRLTMEGEDGPSSPHTRRRASSTRSLTFTRVPTRGRGTKCAWCCSVAVPPKACLLFCRGRDHRLGASARQRGNLQAL
jgi:hypothetical protein